MICDISMTDSQALSPVDYNLYFTIMSFLVK